jgi:RHS repeat-associated protein
MTTMLSLILAFMLSIGGSPAASISPGATVSPVNAGNSSSLNLNINEKPRLGEISKIRLFEPMLTSQKARMISLFRINFEKSLLVGYNNYRNRYYMPRIGRFLQTDPMQYQDSMNLYQAFNLNPVNFTDPFGLWDWFKMAGSFWKDMAKDPIGTINLAVEDVLYSALDTTHKAVHKNIDNARRLFDFKAKTTDKVDEFLAKHRIMKRGQYNFMIKSFEGVIVIYGAVGEVQTLNSSRNVIKNPYLEQIEVFPTSSTDIVHYDTYWSNTPKVLDYRPTGSGYVAVISPSSSSALSPGKSIMLRSDVTYQFDMMNPGPLTNDVAGTFAGGKYSEGIVQSGQIFYRGGDAAHPGGSFFSFNPPKSIAEVRIESAVKPQWINPSTGVLKGKSPVNSLISAEFPVGTKFYYGPAAYQEGIYMGGSMQIYVPDASQIGVFKVLGKLK